MIKNETKEKKCQRLLIGGGIAAVAAVAASVGIWGTGWLKTLGKAILEVVGIVMGMIAWVVIAIAFCIADITAPTPLEPVIQKAEFHYELQYELDGVEKVYNNTMICEYLGIERREEAGAGKERLWKREYIESTTVETLDTYHIICYPQGIAKYYMGDPDRYLEYKNELEIEVKYDDERRNLSKEEQEEFFNEHKFKIISWYCDPPIENTFQ